MPEALDCFSINAGITVGSTECNMLYRRIILSREHDARSYRKVFYRRQSM